MDIFEELAAELASSGLRWTKHSCQTCRWLSGLDDVSQKSWDIVLAKPQSVYPAEAIAKIANGHGALITAGSVTAHRNLGHRQ